MSTPERPEDPFGRGQESGRPEDAFGAREGEVTSGDPLFGSQVPPAQPGGWEAPPAQPQGWSAPGQQQSGWPPPTQGQWPAPQPRRDTNTTFKVEPDSFNVISFGNDAPSAIGRLL
jgi:hypothetical protein